MTITNGIIYPAEGKHLQNIHTNEAYPDFINPAKSLSKDDFKEITAEEYQAYLQALDQLTDSTALEIITEGTEK